MEFIHLVSHGPWKQVWLAAHFDKKVKPEDVFLADIEKITASVRSRKDVTNLRSTGHLVLGACRIYRRKTEMYESQVKEVRNKLVLAFSEKNERKCEANVEWNEEVELLFDEEAAANNELVSSKSHTAKLETTTLPRRPKLANTINFSEEDVTWKDPSDSFDAAALEKKLGIQTIDACLHIDDLNDADHVAVPSVPQFTPDMPLEHDIGQDIGQEQFPADDPMGLSPRGINDIDEHPLYGSPPTAGTQAIQSEHISPANCDDDADDEGHKSKKRKLVKGALVDDSFEIPAKVYYQFTTETEPITLKYPRRQDFRLSLEPYRDRFFMDTSLDSSLFLEMYGDALYIERRKKVETYCKGIQPKEEHPSSAVQSVNTAPTSAVVARQDVPVREEDPEGYVPDFEPAAAGQMVGYSPRKCGVLTMSSVVTGGMDEEEFDGTRVGFSSRTQKMESLVKQEMEHAPAEGLCYKDMCRNQGRKDRHLIAACFFELLVLKTNGVIDVKQNNPYEEIKILEGHKWNDPITKQDLSEEPPPLVDA